MKNLSSWPWEIGCVYTTVPQATCLSVITSELKKLAFLGLCDGTKITKASWKRRKVVFRFCNNTIQVTVST